MPVCVCVCVSFAWHGQRSDVGASVCMSGEVPWRCARSQGHLEVPVAVCPELGTEGDLRRMAKPTCAVSHGVANGPVVTA